VRRPERRMTAPRSTSLIPQVVDVAGDVPVVAAGGIADGPGDDRSGAARRGCSWARR
jgi:NAD(P)H-dependent flavin oxidoreductase YrpB (nitropropane dioxygenase family)